LLVAHRQDFKFSLAAAQSVAVTLTPSAAR